MSGFGNSFVQAFNPAFRQGASDYSDQIRQTLLNKQRIEDEQRRALEPHVIYAQENGLEVPTDVLTNEASRVKLLGAVGNHMRTQKILDSQNLISADTKARLDAQHAAEDDASGYTPEKGPRKAFYDALKLNNKRAEKIGSSQAAYEADSFLIPKENVKYDEAGNLTPETLKQISDAQVVKDQSKTRNANLGLARDDARRQGLVPDSKDYNQYVDKRVKYYTAPADFKSGYLQADQQVRAGIIPKDDDSEYEKTAARFAQFGGHAPTLDTNQQNTLTGDNVLLGGIENIRGQINKFNAEHPTAKFNSFIGPFDNRALKFNLAVNEDASPEAKQASRILGAFQSLMNRKIKDQSGTAVTANEMMRQLLEAGDPQSANFENAFNGFNDAIAMQYGNRLKALQDYAIPDSLKLVNGKPPEEHIGAWKQAPAVSAASGNQVIDQLRQRAANGDAKAVAYLKSQGF